jgi:hypothetical protein
MNFKLKKNKLIASILIPLVIWMAVFFLGNKFPSSLISFIEIHNFSKIFSSGNIFLFVIEFVIIYLIYSFFQSEYAY